MPGRSEKPNARSGPGGGEAAAAPVFLAVRQPPRGGDVWRNVVLWHPAREDDAMALLRAAKVRFRERLPEDAWGRRGVVVSARELDALVERGEAERRTWEEYVRESRGGAAPGGTATGADGFPDGAAVALTAPDRGHSKGARGTVEGRANGAVMVRMQPGDEIVFIDPAKLRGR